MEWHIYPHIFSEPRPELGTSNFGPSSLARAKAQARIFLVKAFRLTRRYQPIDNPIITDRDAIGILTGRCNGTSKKLSSPAFFQSLGLRLARIFLGPAIKHGSKLHAKAQTIIFQVRAFRLIGPAQP